MSDYRLPTNVIPDHYDLFLYPDLSTGLFRGKMVASVIVRDNVEKIKMHSNGLNVTAASIDMKTAKVEVDKNFELLHISLDGETINAGKKIITIEYAGDMKNRIVGLYISSYKNQANAMRAIATSKFEPTYARQAYPCFDEPNMKANFTVHLLKPKDQSYIALSNMPEESSEDTAEGTLVHFKTSVKMSTYLSCFIVSDFNYTENIILPGSDKIPLRVYATPHQLAKTEFAKDISVGVIEYYIKYFGIPYPLPKLDLAAIPDFVSGAMEHWGLVTFRETALLYDNTTSSSGNKQRVASVVAHELAHSWFGNLVTMDWWNDLWLNEGFATYIENKGVDAVLPDWKMLDQFLISELHPVLSVDATIGSHPIVQTVLTPNQITELFDTITYSKGASILRMLEQAVGPENFQKGVTAYLNKHAWGNAVTQDLLNELQTIVGNGINVTDFMNTWTIQMGYPIATLRTDGNNYVLTQSRYLTDPSSGVNDTSETPYRYRWTIPITYITDEMENATTVWFMHEADSITIPKPATAKWIKFNHNQVGYYRINYEDQHWKTLADNMGEMTISDKTHLIEESFSIAESGQLDYKIPLEMINYMRNEINYIPWSVASAKLGQIKKYLYNSLYYTNFMEHVINIVTTAYDNLTWTENVADSHLTRLARVTVVSLACSMGHEQCLQEAHNKFQEWIAKPTEIALSQDLRSLIYNYGMARGTKEEWHKLWSIFVNEIDANEKQKLMVGLTYTTDPALLTRLVELAQNETYIRSQDYFSCLQNIAANSIGTSIVWDYVRENWGALVDRFGLNERYLGRMIPSITSTFSTKTKLQEMEAFFAAYPNAGAGAAARGQALQTVRNNIKWVDNYKQVIEDWLNNQKSLL